MSDEDRTFFACIIFATVMFASVVAAVSTDSYWRKWSIEVNAAHYDAVTGKWKEGPRPVVQQNESEGCDE